MLERFGFTPTENRVYQTLLKLGSTTGYAVASDLGVARANVYQALESLVRRGAGRKSATNPVQYTATGPAALVAELERSFQRELATLEDELSALPLAGSFSGTELELITGIEQLLNRASSCIDAASSEILIVTGPWAERVNARFPFATARRVQVRAVSLGDPAPDGAIARPVPDAQLTSYWGGLPLAVVSDRGRAVFGVIRDASASGIATTAAGVVPFLRHLLRRELTPAG